MGAVASGFAWARNLSFGVVCVCVDLHGGRAEWSFEMAHRGGAATAAGMGAINYRWEPRPRREGAR